MEKPLFQRRHYEILAQVFGQARRLNQDVEKVAIEWFSADNSKFNHGKFLDACRKYTNEPTKY